MKVPVAIVEEEIYQSRRAETARPLFAHRRFPTNLESGHLAFLFSATMSSIIRRELEAAEPERTASARAA